MTAPHDQSEAEPSGQLPQLRMSDKPEPPLGETPDLIDALADEDLASYEWRG